MSPKRLLPLIGLAVTVACQDAVTPLVEPLAGSMPEPALVPGMQGAAEQVVPGRVIARFVDGFTAEDVAGPYGLTVASRHAHNAFVTLRGPAGNERALAATLNNDPRVVWAEPDYLRQTTVDPRLWAFNNPGSLQILFTRGGSRGQPVSNYLSTADADEDAGGGIEGDMYGAGGAAVRVGSLDTGVESTHPELSGLVIAGTDWISSDNDPSDTDGHGTHTTGTMVGRTMGVASAAGAGGNVVAYVQRVCGPNGCPSSAIASAILEAVANNVVAMNLSLSGSTESQAEKDAIAAATNANVLVIASAGNGGTGTVGCPACDPNAISVGASNWQDAKTYYTNWGPGLDIVAPGGELYSNTTEEAGILSAYLGGGLKYLQGTSMAAPQVTGTAGVVASKTGLRGAALRNRLLWTTDDKGPTGYDTDFGCGRLNTHKATTTSPTSGCGAAEPPAEELTAAFSISCNASSTCNFNASASTGATTYAWTFSNGGAASGVTASKSYSAAGSYGVTLTVGDGSGTDTLTKTVVCTLRGPNLRCK
jgi:serine protease